MTIPVGTLCLIRNAAPWLGANGQTCEVIRHGFWTAPDDYTVNWRGAEWGASEKHLIPLTPPPGNSQALRDRELEKA